VARPHPPIFRTSHRGPSRRPSCTGAFPSAKTEDRGKNREGKTMPSQYEVLHKETRHGVRGVLYCEQSSQLLLSADPGVLRPQPRSRWSDGTKVGRTLCGGTLPVTPAYRARRALRSAWYQGCRGWACRQHCAASMHRVEKMLGLASAMRGRGGWKRFVHSCVQFLLYSASMLCIPSMYSRPCISTIPDNIGAETGSPDVLTPYLPGPLGDKTGFRMPQPLLPQIPELRSNASPISAVPRHCRETTRMGQYATICRSAENNDVP
jgi:hypothetical protein